MRRSRMSPRRDRKVFRRTAKQHKANTVTYVMRGGIRK